MGYIKQANKQTNKNYTTTISFSSHSVQTLQLNSSEYRNWCSAAIKQ